MMKEVIERLEAIRKKAEDRWNLLTVMVEEAQEELHNLAQQYQDLYNRLVMVADRIKKLNNKLTGITIQMQDISEFLSTVEEALNRFKKIEEKGVKENAI